MSRSNNTDFDDWYIPEPNSGCWIWLGGLNKGGYGYLRFDGYTQLSHRVSYQRHSGPIPADMEIDHLCRMRCCCNPDHLEAVSASTNVRRSYAARGYYKIIDPVVSAMLAFFGPALILIFLV